MILNYLRHFKIVTIHKYWVFRHCCKAGIPIAGLVHDLSKYSITEFRESVKYYDGTKSPIGLCKEDIGYSKAWLHHKGRNKHHYEYWQDEFDKGTYHIQMPYRYAIEMVCDMLAASKVYNGKKFTYEKFYDYWCMRKHSGNDTNAMHPQTKMFVNEMVHTIFIESSEDCLRKERSVYIFKKTQDTYLLSEKDTNNKCRDNNNLF